MCVVLPFLPFRTEGCLLFDLLAFVEAAALLERRLIVVSSGKRHSQGEYTGEVQQEQRTTTGNIQNIASKYVDHKSEMLSKSFWTINL